MMTNNSSAGNSVKSLVNLVLLVATISALGALGFSNSDFGKFFRSRAEAERIQADIAWQEQLRQIELPHVQAEREAQAKVARAQTEAELARIEIDKAAYAAQAEEVRRAQVEQNNQRLAAQAKLTDVGIDLLRAGSLALILILTGVSLKALLRLVERKIPVQQIALQPMPINSWRNPNFRREQIELARQREYQARKSAMNGDYTQNGRQFRKVIIADWEE